MTEEHTNELYNLGKILYKEKDLPMDKTCMCWGFECPDSWFNLLKQLTIALEYYNNQYKDDLEIVAHQVKTKFGSLRFYYDVIYKTENNLNNISEIIDNYINKAEEESWNICCKCENKASLTSVGWVDRYCEKCVSEYPNKTFKKD